MLDDSEVLLGLKLLIKRTLRLFVSDSNFRGIHIVKLVFAKLALFSNFLNFALISRQNSIKLLLVVKEAVLEAGDPLSELLVTPPFFGIFPHPQCGLALSQEDSLGLVRALKIFCEIALHATHLTFAPFKSSEIGPLEVIQVLGILLEASLDDLSRGLLQRVTMLIGHLTHKIHNLIDLAIVSLSHVDRSLLSLFDIGEQLIPESVHRVRFDHRGELLHLLEALGLL